MRVKLQASRIALYALLAVWLLSACATRSDEPQPPEIIYSQDVCDGCDMIISDPKYAAATILINGETRKFDDIGEMLAYHMDHPEAQVKVWFVHDHDSEKWVRGETAFFVRGDLTTSMGDSIAAFTDRAAAEAFAAEVNGKVYSLDELRVEVHLTMH